MKEKTKTTPSLGRLPINSFQDQGNVLECQIRRKGKQILVFEFFYYLFFKKNISFWNFLNFKPCTFFNFEFESEFKILNLNFELCMEF